MLDRMDKLASVAAAAMGRKGGKARAESLTPDERSAIARKASIARWKKRRKSKRKEVSDA